MPACPPDDAILAGINRIVATVQDRARPDAARRCCIDVLLSLTAAESGTIHLFEDVGGSGEPDDGEPLNAAAVRRGTSLIADHPGIEPGDAQAEGRALAVPLDRDGREVGAILLHGRLGPEDRRIATALAPTILIALTAPRLRDRRMDEEAALRTLVDGLPQLVWRAAPAGEWTWAGPQWVAFTGQAEPDSHDRGWLDPLHPDDRERALAAWERAERSGQLSAELRIRDVRTGQYRWFDMRARLVRDDRRDIAEWLGTATDVDDLRRLQQRQQTLVAELQHRVRNMLSIVRSMFSRSVADPDRPLAEIVDHFTGRLDALARIEAVVTRDRDGLADLDSLIRDELLSVGLGEGPNLAIGGPDVVLTSVEAEAIGLAIHELVTNAVKFGALQSPAAKLSICWQTNAYYGDGGQIVLEWVETGVPVVPVAPSRRGFGVEMIEEALPYRIGAQTHLDFTGGGVRCRIAWPLRAHSLRAPGG